MKLILINLGIIQKFHWSSTKWRRCRLDNIQIKMAMFLLQIEYKVTTDWETDVRVTNITCFIIYLSVSSGLGTSTLTVQPLSLLYKQNLFGVLTGQEFITAIFFICYIRGLVPKTVVKLNRFSSLRLIPRMDFSYSTFVQSVLQLAPYSTSSHSQQ